MAETFSLVQRHKSRGIKTWYVRTSNNGRESFKSTGTSVKAEAMKFFAEYVKEAGESQPKVSASSIILVDEIDRWLKIVKAKFGDEGRTFKLYRNNIGIFSRFIAERNVTSLGKMTKSIAQDFVNGLMEEGKKPSTIELNIRCTKIFFNWMIETYDLQIRSPFLKVMRPKVEHRKVDFWTSEECDAILDKVADKYWKAFFGLQCFAGLRFNECHKLNVEDIKDGMIAVLQDKTGKDSLIPISSKLKDLLDAAIDGRTCGNLFKGRVSRCSSVVNKHIKIAVEEAGLADRGRAYCHRLRHSFASNLLRGGVDIKATQTLGRWSSPDILLKHYAGVIPEELKKAVNLL